MSVLPACRYGTVCTWHSLEAINWDKVVDPHVFWELNPGPLQKVKSALNH